MKGSHDIASGYWGLIGLFIGEKSGSRSSKWLQNLDFGGLKQAKTLILAQKYCC